jgi:hypothetical protein
LTKAGVEALIRLTPFLLHASIQNGDRRQKIGDSPSGLSA